MPIPTFSQHSLFSNPEAYAELYDPIPDDINSIVEVVQQLIVHYLIDGYKPTPERLCEIDTRYKSTMLERIIELDARPLTEARPIEKRFIGCCRDYSLLTVSILRHKGIPARVRYGAGAYFSPNFYGDHAILEYWNGSRWVSVDAQMSPEHIQRFNINFNVFDVPHEQFIRGGQAWLMYRKEGKDPNQFGIAPSVPIKGIPIIITEMLLDLAALNKVEMLCWDSWGFASAIDQLTEDDMLFLDHVAEATLDDTANAEWEALYQHEKAHVPKVLKSFSPAISLSERPLTVELRL